MGGGRKQTPTIDESSSGFHLVELHGTSYGMGFGSFFLIVLCGVMGWLFYKKCCQSRPVNTVTTMPHFPPPVSYTPGSAVSLPMHYPLQRTDSFPVLQQPQQPLQMLENAFNNLMSRALTTRNDNTSDLGINRDSDAYIDRLPNLSSSNRISEQTTDENG